MKFRVTMKTPDALDMAIRDAVDAEEIYDGEGSKQDAKEYIADLCRRWFKYSETLTVEIDTEAQTCILVEAT